MSSSDGVLLSIRGQQDFPPVRLRATFSPGGRSKLGQMIRHSINRQSQLYHQDAPPSLTAFKKLCAQSKQQRDYPLSAFVDKNIPVYDLSKYSGPDAQVAASLQSEWNRVLLSGPGVLVLKKFFTNGSLLTQVNEVFADIISSEGATSKGDHFGAAGKNSRIWNSFQKHALRDPTSFVEYYANPWLALIAESWLGPAYQITAQLNIVRPGGAAQDAHRDYHLGFQTGEQCARFPKAMQIASQLLTLQGGVAHTGMPLESGPTRFLPFSQLFEEGYLAYRLPEFRQYFEQSWVSLPLELGDVVFFNPALFHAAGENVSQADRSANLLQISSAFGKPMESIDTVEILRRCWEPLKQMSTSGVGDRDLAACVCAIASGYPFPTNLDRRPPGLGGMTPCSEADILFEGLKKGWETSEVVDAVLQLRLDSLG